MASLDQAIAYTQIFQDIELSHALQNLRQDPQALQRFLQSSQDKLFKEVTGRKDETFQKVYGDLGQASDAENAIYLYEQRTNDLNTLQEKVYTEQGSKVDTLLHDRDNSKRQYEINQWSSGNKMDTLFIYSQLFIILCTGVIMVFLWNTGVLSSALLSILTTLLLLIFTFTVANRAQYTLFLRDNRYWNRRKFPVYQVPHIPNICGASASEAETSAMNMFNSAEQMAAHAEAAVPAAIQHDASSINADVQSTL